MVKSGIGGKGFTFFTSEKHGDVFVHAKCLETNGFYPDDLVAGCTAVIDTEPGKAKNPRTTMIHEINCRLSRLDCQSRQARKRSRADRKKPRFEVGVRSKGRVIILEQGYGFIRTPDCQDLFFPLACVERNLTPCLEEGVDVRFTTKSCERGVMAYVTHIIWPESGTINHLIQSDESRGLHTFRIMYPDGLAKLEITDSPLQGEGKLVAKPMTLTEARNWIENGVFLTFGRMSA